MLTRKKRRIAHGTDGRDAAIDNQLQDERRSILTNLQSKWGKLGSTHGVPHKKELAPQKRLFRRQIPGLKLRARMLLKKVKETCVRFLSSKVLRKKDEFEADFKHNETCMHCAEASNVRVGRRAWMPKSPSQPCHQHQRHRHHNHHHHHQQHHHHHQHHPHQYPIFPSLADADAIADCIEFIKRSSSSSFSSSSSTSFTLSSSSK